MATAAVGQLAEDRDPGARGSVSDFAEALEAKATMLELAGSGSVAADLRKWATELRRGARLHDFAQSDN